MNNAFIFHCPLCRPCFTFNLKWGDWLKVNSIYMMDMCFLVLGGFVLTVLFVCHTYLMLTNLTTWELVSRERITYLKSLDQELNPFHEGYIRNAYHFLCSMTARKWDMLYNKNASLQDSTVWQMELFIRASTTYIDKSWKDTYSPNFTIPCLALLLINL